MKKYFLNICFVMFIFPNLSAQAIEVEGVIGAKGLALNTKITIGSGKQKKMLCYNINIIDLGKFKGTTFRVEGEFDEVLKCIKVKSLEPIKTPLGHTILMGKLVKMKNDEYIIRESQREFQLGKIPNYMTKLQGKNIIVGVKQNKAVGPKDKKFSIYSVREYPFAEFNNKKK